MYGEHKIKNDALKRWAKSISLKEINFVDIGGDSFEVTPEDKEVLETQVKVFSRLIENMKPDERLRSFRGILSPLFYNAFFRVNNSAIRIANYYECLLTPSNIKTYKKIIKGFDYLEIGSVQLYDGRTCIGEIGKKSSLFFSIFYEYFINEGKYGDIQHIHSNHDEFMSIQLFDIENLSNDVISQMINEILLKISMDHDLDFSIVELDSNYKAEGEAKIYGTQFHSVEFEQIPALYFSNALHTQDARLAYLSYYQVLEYFFVRAQNNHFLEKYNALSIPPIDHNELRKVLQHYKNSLNERDSLKLVLKSSLNIEKFKSWLALDDERIRKFCDSKKNSLDLSKSDEQIINKLGERIYTVRCAIAHSKGDVDDYIAIPFISNSEIYREIELIKYVAYEGLKSCSNH